MTVQEQSSPRFEINPLPARAHPADRAGRSPPPRPLFPAPDIARQSEPPDPNRPRITVQAPPSGPASTTVLGEKFSNFFFPFNLQAPPPLTQRWGMKFGPAGAIGRGRARSAIPCPAPDPFPCLRTPGGTIPPAIPGMHYCAVRHLPHAPRRKWCVEGEAWPTGAKLDGRGVLAEP